MGIYDRDYGRDERTPWDRIENSRSITTTLIIINAAVWLADVIFADRSGGQVRSLIADWCAVDAESLTRPWMWWQLLTYGFVHSLESIFHLLFNMFMLFVFGRDVEQKLGRMEFLRFYLVAVIAGGIVGAVTDMLDPNMVSTVGASGAVIAVVILFACFFPNREILLMMVFPIKAWVLAAFCVFADLIGALGASGSNTAFTVHLAGAFFALAYFFLGWNLRWLDFGSVGDLPRRMRQRSRRMKLKLHDPDRKLEREADEADRILAKIHASGESSLTSSERKTLERYSRRQREKRNHE